VVAFPSPPFLWVLAALPVRWLGATIGFSLRSNNSMVLPPVLPHSVAITCLVLNNLNRLSLPIKEVMVVAALRSAGM
jgi:hypothetical protein